jgi:hypothetical protein
VLGPGRSLRVRRRNGRGLRRASSRDR